MRGNPVGVQINGACRVSQGALADSRPWAMLDNPVGVHTTHSGQAAHRNCEQNGERPFLMSASALFRRQG